MKRITEDDVEWAYARLLLTLELVARQLAADGEPELAAQLRAWR